MLIPIHAPLDRREEHSSKRGMEVEANWRRSVCEEKALKLPV